MLTRSAWFCLQTEGEDDNVVRLLTEICSIIIAASNQLRRLSVFTRDRLGAIRSIYLPWKLIMMISTASALESLTVAIPQPHSFTMWAEAIRSLCKLKVRTVSCTMACG
jgi:hypothetical protein